MARSKNNSDKLLIYAIGGVLLLIIGLSIALVVASSLEPADLEYEEFDHLTNLNTLEDQDESVYAVYYYQVNCGACVAIKQEILQLVKSNDSNLKIYLVDATNTVGTKDHIVINGEDLSHTPTMLVYRDGKLVDLFEGGTAMQPFIDDVERGNYSN